MIAIGIGIGPTFGMTDGAASSAVGPPWILATGFWNDSGIWKDDAVWID